MLDEPTMKQSVALESEPDLHCTSRKAARTRRLFRNETHQTPILLDMIQGTLARYI